MIETYYQKHKEERKEYYKKNKEERNAKTRAWQKENPEKVKARDKRYYQKHKEERKAYRREYYHNHKEEQKEKTKKWQKEYPHRIWSINTLSKHRGSGFEVNVSIDELEERAKITDNCIYCGRKLAFCVGKGRNGDTPSLDRINNGNELNLSNIQIICYQCNAWKGNRSHKRFIEDCKGIVERFERK